MTPRTLARRVRAEAAAGVVTQRATTLDAPDRVRRSLCTAALLAPSLIGLGGCGGSGGGSGDAPADSGGSWTIPSGPGTRWRAVHMGGNWGTNVEAVKTLPAEYFEYLRDLNVNWVGINVALHLADSMDPSVARRYDGVRFPTFTDDVLASLIRRFRRHGFNVYVTLAFELAEAEAAARPLRRWQLGDPFAPAEDARIAPADWPWALEHPQHARFIADFWAAYTEQAVHFGRIAQAEGVGLYSLGGETDRLFRSRAGGRWPNAFGNELGAMVRAVRAVYGGRLTYNMHYDAVKTRSYFGAGSDHLWEDLALDVVGVSAYFPLLDTPPAAPASLLATESAWGQVFDEHLAPLKARNPGRPILFTECGYVDSVRAPFEPAAEEFALRVAVDTDGNGIEDGAQTQASVYQALFNLMNRRPGVVEGAFLWGMMMSDARTWADGFGKLRGFDFRGKPAEAVVRSTYAAWRG